VERAAVRKAVADARTHGYCKEGDRYRLYAPGARVPRLSGRRSEWFAWCAQSLGCPTLLDITGVGKGVPEQPWLQASLLAAAQAAGLALAVIDPAVAETLKIRTAGGPSLEE